jgi:hypothetical protein
MLAKFILVSLFTSAAFATPPSGRYSIERCPMDILHASSPPFSERTLNFSSLVTLRPGALVSEKRQQVISLVLEWINSKNVNFGGNFEYRDFIEGFRAYDERYNALLAVGTRGNDWTLTMERSNEIPGVRVGMDLALRTRGQEIELDFKLSYWSSEEKTSLLPGAPRFYRDIITQLEGEVYSIDTLLSARPLVFQSGEGEKLIKLIDARRGVPLVYLPPKADTEAYSANATELAISLVGRALVIQVDAPLVKELKKLGHAIPNNGTRVTIFEPNGSVGVMYDCDFPYSFGKISRELGESGGAAASN